MASEARPDHYDTKRLPRNFWVLVMTLECTHCWYYLQYWAYLIAGECLEGQPWMAFQRINLCGEPEDTL